MSRPMFSPSAIPADHQAAIVAGTMLVGATREEAQEGLDLAMHAHAEAIRMIEEVCSRAGCFSVEMSARTLAVQFVATDAERFKGALKMLAEKIGAPMQTVTAQGGQQR